MSRRFVVAVGLGLVASTALALPAESSNSATPTTTLQETWTIPTQAPAGAVISVRPPGLYYSPDSTRLYSLLDRRSLGGYGCDGSEGSRFETIDAATGAVMSARALDLPARAPVHHFAMDDAAQRIVVNTGCLEKYLWTSFDAATGARISQWQTDSWTDRVAMGVDPGVVFIITGRGKVANGDYRKVVEAVETTSGRTLWSRSLEGAAPYQGGWLSSTLASGRQYEGQPMAVSADGTRLFVLRWWSNQVEVINVSSGSSEGRIDLPASTDLRNIVASPVDPRAFVTDWSNNRIHVLDTETRSVVKTLPVDGRCLESVAIDATGELLAVNAACDQPRILLIRSADGSKANEVAVPGDVTQLAVAPNGRGMVVARNANLAGLRFVESLPATTPSRKTRPIPAPTDPRNVTAATAPSSAVVTWLAPANATRAKVSSYRVTARPGGATCTVKARNPLKCTFSGLTPGRRYVFQVQARNPAQFGLRSDSAIVTIPVPTPVTPPSPEKPQQEFT
jgi:YVTN family beta-propeller protein